LLTPECKAEPQNDPALFKEQPNTDEDFGLSDLARLVQNELRPKVLALLSNL
jgi:hypothetical protein